jgi:HK97 family phage major capsid protein
VDPFLDLSQDLDLARFDLRALIEGRAAVLDEIEALTKGPQGETRDLAALSDDDGAKFDGLTERAETLATEIEAREAKQRGEQRSQRVRDLRGAERGSRPAPRPSATERRSGGRREVDPVADPDAAGYSIIRAINLRLQNRPLDGVEAEVSEEIARRSGRQAQGFFIPLSLMVDRRSIELARQGLTPEQRAALSTSTGGGAVPTITAGTMIDALRALPVLMQLGATAFNDLVGDFEVPKETNVGSHYWVTEDNDVSEDSPTIGQVAFAPKTIGAYTDLTRKFLKQTSVDGEQFVRRRLTKNLALGIDLAGINGSGESGQPTGILQNENLVLVEIGDDGGPLTWAKVVELESLVASENALVGNLAYLTHPLVRGQMKTTERAEGTARFLMADDGSVNGYRTAVSTQVPTDLTKGYGEDLTALIFGDFSQLAFAFWGGLDILVDPYTKSKSGGVRVVALQDCDIDFMHDEAFTAIAEVDTSGEE